MTNAARILIYGQDPTLTQTRYMLLQHAGFDVISTLEFQAFRNLLETRSFDLFILCHSLSARNCENALAVSHSLPAGPRNLVLSTALSACTGGPEDATLSAFAHPETLIEKVSELVARHSAHSQAVQQSACRN